VTEGGVQAGEDEDDEPLPLQIGLHTGLALLTPSLTGESGAYAASGATISLANRLMQRAESTILISHEAYVQVRGAFDIAPDVSLRLRGRRKGVRVYRVLGPKARAFRDSARGVEGVETEMVGREVEIVLLRNAFLDAVEEGETQVVTVVGGAGLGKSRLLSEFLNWADLHAARFTLLYGRATPEMMPRPHALLRDVISLHFEILDSDSPAEALRKLEAGIAERTDQDDEMAHLLGYLAGFDVSDSPFLKGILDDPQQLARRARQAFKRWLGGLCATGPVVLALENIHHADAPSLDALSELAGEDDVPLVVVCTARPALYERYPDWGGGQGFHRRFALEPLDRRASRALVREVLRKADDVPKALRDLLVERCEGNPYYLEELVKMLIDDRVIVVESEARWRVETDRLQGLRLPATLAGLLQARLDTLLIPEKLALQRAAVVGKVFHDGALSALDAADETHLDDLPGALARLVERGFIRRRGRSAFEGSVEYRFAGNMLRDLLERTLLRRQERAYNVAAAGWLVQVSGGRVDEYSAVIAGYYEKAGESGQAAHYLRRAGEKAAAQYANEQAVEYLSRALALAPEDVAERYALLLAREGAYKLQGAREAQAEDLASLERLAEALDGPQETARRAQVALRRSYYAYQLRDFPAAIAAARKAARLAQVGGETGLEAEAYRHWGDGLHLISDSENLEEARARYERALSLARTTGMRRVEAASLRGLGYVLSGQGHYTQARVCFEQALPVTIEIGDLDGEAWATWSLGGIARAQGDYTQSWAYLKRALRTRREIGHRWGEAWVVNSCGALSLTLGDYAGARACLEESVHLFRETSDPWGEASGLGYLGLLSHREGDDEAAREYGQQALPLAREAGVRSAESLVLYVLGHALAGLEEWDRAADAYRQALDIWRERGQHKKTMESLAGLACVALAQGNTAQAQATVEEILGYLETNPALHGAEEPLWVYFVCYQVLQANGDPRAQEVLSAGHSLLQERADEIDDGSLRRSYLENVPYHCEIVQAYARNEERS
jgi:predicted ATPase